MGLGDRRYRQLVSPETRAADEILFADDQDSDTVIAGKGCEWYVPGLEAPPYVPESFIEFTDYAADRLEAEGRPEVADSIRMSEVEKAIHRRANQLRSSS